MCENTVNWSRILAKGCSVGESSQSAPKDLGKKAPGYTPNALLIQTIRIGSLSSFRAGAETDSKVGRAIDTPAAFRNNRRPVSDFFNRLVMNDCFRALPLGI